MALKEYPVEIKKIYKKQHYALVGKYEHSAVKFCKWTKESLRKNGRVCYKSQFYGISPWRCVQMTPALFFCTHKCIFCWRAIEATLGPEMKSYPIDEPKDVVAACIEGQRKLLTGFGGYENVDRKRLLEAQQPKHFAISLAGEPTLYPYLSDLIKEIYKRGITSFLVSNGTMPEKLEALETLPTQLYISLEAPNEQIYRHTCNPIIPNAWEKFNESLELFPSLNTRKVLRLTLVKGLNMCAPEGYAKLIKKAAPDFVEPKAFMLVGGARERGLTLENMPRHEEVKQFAEKINEHLGYELIDEKKDSRVVLLSSGEKKPKIKF